MAYTQWLPISRRGGGEYNTANTTIPTGVDEIRVHLLLQNDSVFADSSLSINITVQTSAYPARATQMMPRIQTTRELWFTPGIFARY